MPEEIISLIKGDKHGVETDYRDSLPVNMSGVLRPMFGAKGYMLQQPGLTEYGQGIGIDRGGLWNERLANHFRISGDKLIKVNTSGSSTSLGTISGLKQASLPYSFNTQGIVADEKFWLWDGSTLTQVTDPNIGLPIDGVWVDGYYFLTDGEYLYHTDIASETTIDPLQYATSELSPDPTLGVGRTTDNKVIVFDRYSIEYFVNRANENFVFSRSAGRSIKAGIVGTHCKAEVNGKWYIMGGRKKEDVAIHSLGTGSYQKVSSREVDKLIGAYSEAELSDCILEARTIEDYPYLIVHLPNETLLFNEKLAAAAGKELAWSILKSDVLGDKVWRGINGLFDPRLGQFVYGDKRSSSLAILDDTVATHYDELAEWELNTPLMYLDSASIDELEIETIAGHTVDEGASVFVSLTYDGVTHGTEHTEDYGEPSEYGKRFILYRLGYVANWVGIKLRGASRSRMAFSRAKIKYG